MYRLFCKKQLTEDDADLKDSYFQPNGVHKLHYEDKGTDFDLMRYLKKLFFRVILNFRKELT